MKRLVSIFLSCVFLVLLSFVLLQGSEKQLLEFLKSSSSRAWYALASFVVLASDIFMPVPSSLVMILNGKLLGVAGGTLLSTSSGMLSSAIGFALGQKSSPLLRKIFSPEENVSSSKLFLRYGSISIAFSKALPVLSETISVIAGTTSMSWKEFLCLSLVGHFGISLVYAWLGNSFAFFGSGWLSAAVISGFILAAYLVSRYFRTSHSYKRKS